MSVSALTDESGRGGVMSRLASEKDEEGIEVEFESEWDLLLALAGKRQEVIGLGWIEMGREMRKLEIGVG